MNRSRWQLAVASLVTSGLASRVMTAATGPAGHPAGFCGVCVANPSAFHYCYTPTKSATFGAKKPVFRQRRLRWPIGHPGVECLDQRARILSGTWKGAITRVDDSSGDVVSL